MLGKKRFYDFILKDIVQCPVVLMLMPFNVNNIASF